MHDFSLSVKKFEKLYILKNNYWIAIRIKYK